jgi:hypothetical protein
MLGKKLFYFCLCLNGLFYFVLAFFFYGQQNKNHQEELETYHRNIAKIIDQEMTDRKEFYERWFNHLYLLPLKEKAQRELFFKSYDINYLGKIIGGQLLPLEPFKKAPPFSTADLKENARFLFYRDAASLYFTYTLSDPTRPETTPPHVVVQREDRAYFLRRAARTGVKIVIMEKEGEQKPETLFSNLKPEQTRQLEKDFTFNDLNERIYTLSQEPFFVIALPLHSVGQFYQVMILAFSMKAFFFTASFSMAVFLLACFCASSGLLYFGYLKSRS